MKLDKRIIEGKKPLTCFDVEEAREFIGKEGYFAGDLSVYQKLDYFQTWTLQEIKNNISRCFKDNVLNEHWNYFLPKEWVKEEKKEPKYRPFSLAEWIEQHEIGEVIHYRNKSEGIEFRLMYMGYAHGIGKNIKDVGVGAVTLGLASYTLDYCFDYYEIEIDGKWWPFGVEDKE